MITFIDVLMKDISTVYSKFGIRPDQVPYSSQEHQFRVECLLEEWQEYIDSDNNHDKLDAVVDLLIFAAGTVYRQGANITPEQVLEYFNDIYRSMPKTWDSVHSLINDIKYMPFDGPVVSLACISLIEALVLPYFNEKYDITDSDFLKYYKRVVNANMSKELGPNNKRGSYALDLVKPKNWVGPSYDEINIKLK